MGPYQERVIGHVREHIGEIARTLPFDDLELLVIDRAHDTVLVTCGMSARPLTVPEHIAEREDWQHAELCMIVPAAWEPEDWYVGALLAAARHPHAQATWISHGHTVFDGTPWPGTLLTSLLFVLPFTLPDASTVAGAPTIHLFQAVALTAAELAYKLEHKTPALLDELLAYDPHVFMAIEPTRRCAFTEQSPLASTVLLPRPTVNRAWLVVPARTGLDRVLDLAARSLGATTLRIRDATCSDGSHLLLVHGAPLVRLAHALSFAEQRSAALRIYDDEAAARLFHDGTEQLVRGTAHAVIAAVAAHLGTTPEALRSAHTAPAESRIVRWERPDARDPDNPNIVWDTLVDDELEANAIFDRLVLNAPLLLDRFGVWRRAMLQVERLAELDESAARVARHDAAVAHGHVIELVRSITDHPSEIVLEQLAHVLVDRGVSPDWLDRFRA